MPLYMAENGQDVVISRITGTDTMKTHLNNLGFVVGETIHIVNKIDGNIIVKVKGVSVAISQELSKRIHFN